MDAPVVSCEQAGGWAWRRLALALLLSHQAATLCYGAGTAAAWGDNNAGQVSPIPSAALSGVVVVAGGGSHSLALRNDGTVVAWGWDNYGQTNVPAGLTNAIAISAGSLQSMALRADGTVLTWGKAETLPGGLTNIIAIAAGGEHELAVRSGGTVVAWGDNTYGQTNVPAGLSNVVAVAAGDSFSMALQSGGTVVVWGDNTYGQTNVPALASNIVAIAAGGGHCLALGVDGTVAAWGRNDYGQATAPGDLTNAVAIAGGALHSLALRMDGSLAGWGDDTYGQCDVGPGQLNYCGLGAGDYHSLTIRGDGSPVVLLQPASQTAAFGRPVTFQTLVVGTPPMALQWQKNGRNIGGATTDSYTLPNVQLADGGTFTLVISNLMGITTSKPAVLAPAGLAPWIVAQPPSVTNLCGQTANLQVTVGGALPLSYQWCFQGLPVAGATQSGLALSDVGAPQAGEYAVVATNIYGSVTSAAANLTVIVTPWITNQPQDLVVYCGDSPAFQAGATGPTPLSYQWFFEGTPIGSATNSTLVMAGATNANAGRYDVLVSCPCGSVTSSVASLIINPEPPLITSALTATAAQGQPFSYAITALHNPIMYSAAVVPPGLTLNPTNGLISGTNFESGTFYIQLGTINPCAGDSKTLELTVSSGAPVITSAAAARGNATYAFNYAITASRSPTNYSAQNLPPGLIVNPLTGVISGTAPYGGNFTSTVFASNPWGTGSAPLAVSIGSPSIAGLSIVNLRSNYSAPYLVDFEFGLRDDSVPAAGNPLVVDPSLLSVTAFEDGLRVDTNETTVILKRVVQGLLPVRLNLVLDFSESISSLAVFGDSYGDGISDAVHAELLSAELFVTQQPATTLIGVYEFHRKDEAPNRVVGLTNQTAAFNAIAGLWTNYINYDSSSSRCWDAMTLAIQGLGPANSGEIHSVVCVTDGNDNSSTATVQQVVNAAANAKAQVYCIGFGQDIDTTNLQEIASANGGAYYTGQTAGALAGEFAEISDVFTVLYRLRWVTPKQAGDPAFVPSFSIAYEGSSASNNLVTVFIDTNSTPPTTNYVTNFASYLPYTPSNYAGNVNIGLLDLQPNSALPSGASLYANYLPEYIRQFNLHYRLNWPGTVLPATNQGGLLAGWSAVPTDDGSNGTWLLLSSPDPYSAKGVQYNSLPWGDWGSLLDVAFRDQVSTNMATSNLTAFAFFAVDTNIYSTNIPGYFGQTMSNNVNGMVTNLPVLPHGTPAAWLLANGFTTPSRWAEDETIDSDGDGLLNWQEYEANTNPNDRNSKLAIGSVVQSPYDGRWNITFRSALNRDYQVQASTNLLDWRVVQDAIPGTGANIVVVDSTFVPSSQTFYRLLVY